MPSQSNPKVANFLNRFVKSCGVLTVAFGVVVLIGWAFHLPHLKTILPGQVAVKANTGACFILIGVVLLLSLRVPHQQVLRCRPAALTLSLLAAVVGILSFLEYCYGWNLGVDELLFIAGPEDLPGSVRPGLMSPISAFGFTLLGIALALLWIRIPWIFWLSQTFSGVTATVSTFGILDLVFDPTTTHTHISPTTALILFLFSFAVMFSQADRGLAHLLASATSGGLLARVLFPSSVLIPIVIGWLRWKAQATGLYSDWTGVSLMTISCALLLSGVVLWTAFLIDRSETIRRCAEESVRNLASIVTSSNDAIIGKTLDGIVTSWNPGAEGVYGYTAHEMVGQSLSIVIPQQQLEEFRAVMQKIRAGEQVRHRETVRVRKDGKVIHVSISVSPVRDDAGEIIGASTIARDITEGKQAEQELRRASLYTRSLIEASLDPLVTIAKDGKIMDVNRATEAATGFRRDDLIGHDFCNYFTDPDEARKGYERVFAEETVRDYPLGLRHRSGKVADVLYNATVFRNEAGEIEGVFAAARDITPRKRAEEKLRKASLYTRSLIEASLDPLVTISRQGKITDVNQATERVTGLNREQLIGSEFCSYFTEPERAYQGYQQVFASGLVKDYSLAIRHASGQLTEVLYNASVFKNDNGEIEGAFAAARDVTDLKRAEQELRLSRERLALAQQAGHAGTFDWDIQNNINLWTPEVEALHGLAPGEFAGKYEDWEALVVPEDLPAAKSGIESSLTSGEFAGEWRIRRRNDGQIRWVIARAKVLFDDAAKPARMIGINMDVTERKQAEDEVRKLNNELEQRVRDRTAQLEAANKELEAFTYSVSHDLRAPLRHISGFSKILVEDFGSKLPPDAQHLLQRVEEGTHRMGQLVDDLLNLARVGRRDLSLQVTGLRSVVDEVITALKPDIGDRHVEWKIGALPYVDCDAALMKQVFQNLLSNAIKFTRPRDPAIIEVGQQERDGASVVFVRDNGVGFSMKYSDKLFGVFQRLHRTEDFEGTGVGLATVQRIVQKHGGQIWAEAELERGATFYFSLGKSEVNECKAKAVGAGEKA